MRNSLSKKLIELWNTHERVLSFCALAVGFTFDLFLAKRPDSIPDNILLVTYLLVAAAIIVVFNMRAEHRQNIESKTESILLLLILQFCFGGLASNLLILYGKSGTLGGSLFFIGLLIAMMFGNEFLKSQYEHLRFNIAVYYFLLLTYLVIATPTFVFHSVGTGVFLVSGVMSLVFVGVFLAVVYMSVLRGKQKGQQLRQVVTIVAGIFLVFNGLYFLNIIPPVPLSLKNIGIYHTLVRDTVGGYVGSHEPPYWFVFWRDTSSTFTNFAGGPAYCFSSVFAPGGLTAPIVHQWEKYNTASTKWENQGVVSFPIRGGREEGYRGFSTKSGLTPGKWRCNVETDNGQLIGRISFLVLDGAPLALSTVVL